MFAGAGVDDVHVALEATGDDADEGYAVAVFRVHVCLDFENEGGELGGGGVDGGFAAFAGERGW